LEKNNDSPLENFSPTLIPLPNISLTIGYILPHHNLTGGVKMLLEQMRHLHNKGHKIIAFYRGDSGAKVLPDWVNLNIEKEILVPLGESYLSYMDECDIGIAGWLEQLPELANARIPIVYWEQGNEWIFGEKLPPEYRSYLQQCYSQPFSLACVSPIVSKAIEARYKRKSWVIPNGIDVDFYYPAAPLKENEILLVGNPHLLFKGFDIAIRTLFRVWKLGYQFKVKWICQVPPQLDDVPFPFPIKYIVSPTQAELAEMYRESDIFLFTSWYEGFGMPPLEAMASGVPVVSIRCGGVDVYMKDGEYALLADPGDVKGLAEGIIRLLDDPEERQRLSENGRATAMKFKFSSIIKELEQYLIYLVKNNKGKDIKE
jgi:glycosyltransferase involved in cell wall biosynthesis